MRISCCVASGVGLAANVLAMPAFARSSASDPVFSKIPPSDRLTLFGVYSEAAPVMKLAAGLATKATTRPISSGLPIRPCGFKLIIRAKKSGCSRSTRPQ